MIDVGRDLERMRDYIAGRLTDAEQQAFEDRLARDPELVRELELSQRLREGLARLRDAGELHVATRPALLRRSAWGVGLAAMIAGVALLVWLRPGADQARVPLSASAPTTGAVAQFTFISMRGPAAVPVLELPAHGRIEFRASRPAAASGARYRIALERIATGGRRLAAGYVDGLEPGSDALVHAYADAAALTPGDYELRVQAQGDSGAGAEVFAFSVRGAAR